MAHNHHHNNQLNRTRLLIAFLMNVVITVVEIIGGLLSGSLSLISDALHNFSDAAAIVISYIAIKLSGRAKDFKYTFGLKRAQIIAAIINASVLVAISIYLFKEAFMRLINPMPVEGFTMIWVALIGLVANIVGTLILRQGAKGNMNIRSTYLHLLSDALSSMGVVLGGLLIYFANIYWVDPALTILISVYILKESFEILKQALKIVLMASPPDISLSNIKKSLESINGVENIHHVHIWQLDENDVHFEAHAETPDLKISQTDKILTEIKSVLKEEYGVNHVTIQFECNVCDVKEIV